MSDLLFSAWILKERLTNAQLDEKLSAFNSKFAHRTALHVQTGTLYQIGWFSVISQNGGAVYAVNYFPFEKATFNSIVHTRPASEFFDGRFELDKKEGDEEE